MAFIEGVLADGRLLGEQAVDVAGTHYLLLVGLLATDALDLAESCAERMLADARARASIPAQAFVMVHRGWVSFRQGAIAPAEADARTTLELLTAYDISLGTRFALALLIEALIEGGELDAAEQALRTSDLGEEIPPGMANNDLLRGPGPPQRRPGRTREGVEDLVEFGRPRRALGGCEPACLAVALARFPRARRHRETPSGRRGWPRTTSRRHGAGVRRAGSVSRCARPPWWRTARRPWIASRGRRGARGARRRGSSTRGPSPTSGRRCGVRTAAPRREAFLEQGLELAGRCGARALAKQARTELRAAGGRSSDPEGTGSSS